MLFFIVFLLLIYVLSDGCGSQVGMLLVSVLRGHGFQFKFSGHWYSRCKIKVPSDDSLKLSKVL